VVRIALLGETGDIGEALALRWALDTDYELVVGSRDPEKAAAAADHYRDRIESRGADTTLSGASNPGAVMGADVVVLSVPPEYVSDTVDTVAEELADDTVVVCPAVAMNRDGDGFHYDPPAEADSVTAIAHRATPDSVVTVGTFHSILAGRLSDLDAQLNIDTVVLADDEEAAETVTEVAESIDGLRAIRGGPPTNAPEVEGITPLLINVVMNNGGLHNLGVRFDRRPPQLAGVFGELTSGIPSTPGQVSARPTRRPGRSAAGVRGGSALASSNDVDTVDAHRTNLCRVPESVSYRSGSL